MLPYYGDLKVASTSTGQRSSLKPYPDLIQIQGETISRTIASLLRR